MDFQIQEKLKIHFGWIITELSISINSSTVKILLLPLTISVRIVIEIMVSKISD